MSRVAASQVLADLMAARQIIGSPAQWTDVWLARDKHGRGVAPEHESAVRFSGYGALRRAIHESGGELRTGRELFGERMLIWAKDREYPDHMFGLADLNDNYGREAMLAVYDRAIERLERRMAKS